MKKPTMSLDQPPPKQAVRADIVPEAGYSLVVDGHFKSHYETSEAAEAAAVKLKTKYQMLQVQVYDAKAKTRS